MSESFILTRDQEYFRKKKGEKKTIVLWIAHTALLLSNRTSKLYRWHYRETRIRVTELLRE